MDHPASHPSSRAPAAGNGRPSWLSGAATSRAEHAHAHLGERQLLHDHPVQREVHLLPRDDVEHILHAHGPHSPAVARHAQRHHGARQRAARLAHPCGACGQRRTPLQHATGHAAHWHAPSEDMHAEMAQCTGCITCTSCTHKVAPPPGMAGSRGTSLSQPAHSAVCLAAPWCKTRARQVHGTKSCRS